MSNIILPTERRKAQNYNPRLLVLYGRPKTGKSSIVASLESNLIIDLEDGYRALEVMEVQARTATQILEIAKAIREKAKELGKFPYRFITIDNATRLEEMAVSYAAELYRQTPMGNNFGILKDKMGLPVVKDGKPVLDPKADVRTLANGAGWLYMRKAVKQLVDVFKPLCETLILVCHVKDKQIKKDSEELSEMAVDLSGKLSDIICGEADAVGLIYRSGNKTIISFEGGDDTIKEARPLHLRGKKFTVAESDETNKLKIDTSMIFLDNNNN